MAEERDYLDAGGLLIALLQKQLGTEVRKVQALSDLQDVQDRARPTPAIDVYYAGDRAVAGAAVVDGYQEVDQAWVATIVVGSGDPRPGEALRRSGILISRVLEIANGAKLSPRHGLLRRVVPGPRAIVTRWGWQYTPLLFLTRVLSG